MLKGHWNDLDVLGVGKAWRSMKIGRSETEGMEVWFKPLDGGAWAKCVLTHRATAEVPIRVEEGVATTSATRMNL